MPQNQEKSNGAVPGAVNEVVRQQRHSLQPKPSEIPPSSFRHTQSQRLSQKNAAKMNGSNGLKIIFDSEKKKKTKKATVLVPIQPAINEASENENEEKGPEKNSDRKTEQHVFTIESEKRSSKTSKKSEKQNYVYDNGGYDAYLDKRSISSRAGSSRQPSIQSLEVVHEQYCCCAKRTKCEKKLLLTVTVLSIVIVVLVIVLALVAKDRNIAADMAFKFGGAF